MEKKYCLNPINELDILSKIIGYCRALYINLLVIIILISLSFLLVTSNKNLIFFFCLVCVITVILITIFSTIYYKARKNFYLIFNKHKQHKFATLDDILLYINKIKDYNCHNACDLILNGIKSIIDINSNESGQTIYLNKLINEITEFGSINIEDKKLIFKSELPIYGKISEIKFLLSQLIFSCCEIKSITVSKGIYKFNDKYIKGQSIIIESHSPWQFDPITYMALKQMMFNNECVIKFVDDGDIYVCEAMLPRDYSYLLQTQNLSNLDVLIIDDEQACLTSTTLILEVMKMKVYAENSGRKGIDSLIKHKNEIDIILLDIMMEDLSGIEVLKEINTHEDLKIIPVIIQTGCNNEQVVNIGKKPGVIVLIKPYSNDDLKQSIINLLTTSKNN